MPDIEIQSPTANIPMLTILISLLLATVLWIGAMKAFPGKITLFAGTPPTDIGVRSGKLAPCPNSPNCVNSQSQNASDSIDPLTYDSSPTQAMADLKKIIQSQPRTKIVSETENYLYAEFSSALMGFVDDVEFYLDEGASSIQVRSASRLGESDLGVNRKRIETIRAKLNELKSNA